MTFFRFLQFFSSYDSSTSMALSIACCNITRTRDLKCDIVVVKLLYPYFIRQSYTGLDRPETRTKKNEKLLLSSHVSTYIQKGLLNKLRISASLKNGCAYQNYRYLSKYFVRWNTFKFNRIVNIILNRTFRILTV